MVVFELKQTYINFKNFQRSAWFFSSISVTGQSLRHHFAVHIFRGAVKMRNQISFHIYSFTILTVLYQKIEFMPEQTNERIVWPLILALLSCISKWLSVVHLCIICRLISNSFLIHWYDGWLHDIPQNDINQTEIRENFHC